MLSINTNTGQMTAVQILNGASAGLRASQNAVSTGQKVASAKDDGATFAMAQNMRGRLAAYDALSQSRERALSLLDVTTSGLQSISDLVIQMRELATNARDGSLDTASRQALVVQYRALKEQIDTVAKAATFDGQNLLDSDNSTFVKYGPSELPNGTDATSWTGGTLTPQAGSTLTLSSGFSSDGKQDLLVDGTAYFGLRYYDTASGWVNMPLGSSSTTGAALNAANPHVLFQQSATMPTLPATTGLTTTYVAFQGRVYDSDNQTVIYEDPYAISSDSILERGSMEILKMWYPNSTVLRHDWYHQIETNPKNETLAGVDGAAMTLRPTMSGSAGTQGLSLDDTWIDDPAWAQYTLQMLDYAQQKVQGLLGFYGEKTKTVENLQKSETAIADTMRASVGRMTDADMGTEAANISAAQTRQKLAAQSLAIANSQPSLILSLFRR